MRVIFDLDGTLADDTHRAHYLTDGPKKDWDAYFDACDGDAPHTHIIAVLQALVHKGHIIEIWTGRSARVRDKTIAWLHWNGVPFDFLNMRPEKDFRDDTLLKAKWLEDARDCGHLPDMAFEDRARVVHMWREQGIPCCQVAPGKF